MTDEAINKLALLTTLATQENVISRQQALGCGLTRDALAYRIRTDGPWQRLLPGVYLTQTGSPTLPQREMAALLHAGPESVLTGPAALHGLGIMTREPAVIDVLVPLRRRPDSVSFVAVHRTARMPTHMICKGRLLHAAPARALADSARGMKDLREVRALIAGAIQRGQCKPEALDEELRKGPVRHSALLRQVLAEAADGIRSAPEAEFRDLIARAGLPMPMFNARLFTTDGAFIARADAWWPDAGVVAEVDSREWHLSPADWEKTMRRSALLGSYGIIPLHFSPAQIRREPEIVIAILDRTLLAGRARPKLLIVAQPAD